MDDDDDQASVMSDGPSLHRPSAAAAWSKASRETTTAAVVARTSTTAAVVGAGQPSSRQLHCAVCNVWVNSAHMMESHEKGEKHRKLTLKLQQKQQQQQQQQQVSLQQAEPIMEGPTSDETIASATKNYVLSLPSGNRDEDRNNNNNNDGGVAVPVDPMIDLELAQQVPGGLSNPFLKFLSQGKSQQQQQQKGNRIDPPSSDAEEGVVELDRDARGHHEDDGGSRTIGRPVTSQDVFYATPHPDPATSAQDSAAAAAAAEDRLTPGTGGSKQQVVSQATTVSSNASPDSKTSEELFAEEK